MANVGDLRIGRGGKAYEFRGGNPQEKSSWSEVVPSVGRPPLTQEMLDTGAFDRDWYRRPESTTVQEDAAEFLRGKSTVDLMGMAALERIRSAGDAIKGYWGDITGNPQLREEAEQERSRRRFQSQPTRVALGREHPFTKMAGEAAVEMAIPSPYTGAKLPLQLASGAAQTLFMDLLDPEKSKTDMARGAGETVAAQLLIDRITRGLGPKVGIGPSATPQEREVMTKLMEEGYPITPGRRAGSRAGQQIEKEISKTGGGRRAYDKLESEQIRQMDADATKALGVGDAAMPDDRTRAEAFDRIDRDYRNIFEGKVFESDQVLENALADLAEGNMPGVSGPLEKAFGVSPDVQKQAEKLWDVIIDEGRFDGPSVQKALSRARKLVRNAYKSDKGVPDDWEALEQVLSSWAERSAPGNDLKDRLKDVNARYAAWKTLAKPGMVDSSGHVVGKKVANELRKKASENYAKGSSFSRLDPIIPKADYQSQLPSGSQILTSGSALNVASHRFPFIDPRFYFNKMRVGAFPNMPESLPANLTNLTGYLMARDPLAEAEGPLSILSALATGGLGDFLGGSPQR